MRRISLLGFFLAVMLLVQACISPCAAALGGWSNSSGNLTDVPCGGDGCGGPSPGQRDQRVFPVAGVVVAEYVITNAELIALLVASGGAIAGYATVSVNHHDYVDVIDHWNDLVNHITSLWDAINGRSTAATDYAGHHIQVYSTAASEFRSVEQRYNTAKIAQESYEDSKRKGIPVPGNQNEPKLAHNTPTMNERPYSSTDIIERVGDRCPKTRRYFDKDGNAEYDIDFSHGQDANGFPSLPHAHKWKWVGDHVERVTGPDGKVLHIWEGMEEVIRNNLGCIRSNGRTP